MRSAVLCALLIAAPTVAAACPVCFDPNEVNRNAFLAATAFMTGLPLVLIGGVIYYLRRRWQALEAGSLEP